MAKAILVEQFNQTDLPEPTEQYQILLSKTDQNGNLVRENVGFAAVKSKPINNLTVKKVDMGLQITWNNPTDLIFAQKTIIRRSSNNNPQTMEEGVEVYSGAEETVIDTTADLDVSQYYTAWGTNELLESEPTQTEYINGVQYVMLYDQGDECIDVTGGWEAATGNLGTVKKNNNNIVLSGDIAGFVVAVTSNKIDLSKYDKIVGIISNKNNSSYPSYISFSDDKQSSIEVRNPAYDTTLAYLDIDIEGFKYVKIGQNNGASSTWCNMFLLERNSYQVWLTKAGLNPSSYASLDAIVSNQTAMQTLANSTKAVDYMVSCTGTIMGAVVSSTIAMTEIGKSSYAMDKIVNNKHWTKFILMSPEATAGLDASNPITIPAMTSNTTPSGVVSAQTTDTTPSGVLSDANAYCAFDKKYTSDINAYTAGDWISYEFPSPVWIYKVKLYGCVADSAYSKISRYNVYVGNGTDFQRIISDYSVNVGQVANVIPISYVGRHKTIKFELIENNNTYASGRKRYYEEDCFGK